MDQGIRVKKGIDVVDTGKNSSTRLTESSKTSVDVQKNDSSSDSDFGDFSDASIEKDNSNEDQDEDEDSYTTTQLDRCFTLLFDRKNSLILENSDKGECLNENRKDKADMGLLPLEDLIKEERPHVIYEQLFSGRLHAQPFNWRQSYIRSALLRVLDIDQEDEENEHDDNLMRTKKKQEPLDDSLYVKLCHLLESDEKFIHYNTMILKDYFNFRYSPRFIQPNNHDNEVGDGELEGGEEGKEEGDMHSMVNYDYNIDDDNDELNTQIQKLLNQGNSSSSSSSSSTLLDFEKMTDDELQKYHDKLCNVIDLIMIKLKGLNKLQNNLTQDKIIFENVVTNLSGHTQRLQRDEIELYNKKFGRKSLSNRKIKRFSWAGL